MEKYAITIRETISRTRNRHKKAEILRGPFDYHSTSPHLQNQKVNSNSLFRFLHGFSIFSM